MKRCKYKGKIFTFKVYMNKTFFIKDNGVKHYFDKDYQMSGNAFIQVEKTVYNSYKLLRVIWL